MSLIQEESMRWVGFKVQKACLSMPLSFFHPITFGRYASMNVGFLYYFLKTMNTISV